MLGWSGHHQRCSVCRKDNDRAASTAWFQAAWMRSVLHEESDGWTPAVEREYRKLMSSITGDAVLLDSVRLHVIHTHQHSTLKVNASMKLQDAQRNLQKWLMRCQRSCRLIMMMMTRMRHKKFGKISAWHQTATATWTVEAFAKGRGLPGQSCRRLQ